MKQFSSKLFILLLLTGCALAQNGLTVEPSTGRLGWLTRPYRPSTVAAVRLSNSSRLEALIRAGNLYLSAADVVALAVENNIDVEVQRYGPLLAQQVLRRAQSGGVLRNVGVGIAPGAQSVSLQGVSVNTSGGVGISGGSGVSSGGGILTQLGPQLLSFDPTVLAVVNFQHTTIPQNNTVLTGTTSLVQALRTFQAQYVQNWDFGLSVQLSYIANHVHVNSQFFNLNPYTTGDVDLQITQNLLQGFGSAVNTRNIRVQKNNVKVSALQFKEQVIATVSAALNLYWDLVSFDEDVRARKQEVAVAQQLLEDNKKQVQIGSIAEIEITRAEAQLYAGRQDLVIAQTNLLQQETVLKNALSRNGIATADLAEVHIVPLDRIAIPAADETPPLEALVTEAVAKRPEIEQAGLNIQSNQMNLVGIKNSLKPTLQAFAELTNNGLSGQLTTVGAAQPGIGVLAGGLGTFLDQIARRNYPNYSAGFSLNVPLRNRAAQADYATNLLEIRQNELTLRKTVNQVRVEVQNALIGLQQARARYDAAQRARVLQEQTLSADQRRYALGTSIPFQVVQDQRDVASALSSEVQSMANYTHARVALDQAVGRTLEVNHVTVDEALAGRVARPSALPENLPKGERQ